MPENHTEEAKAAADHAHDEDTVDSLLLDTVTQAARIMKIFEKGATDKELVDYLQQETSLARAYLIFFKQMSWIESAESSPYWRLTKRGRDTLELFTNDGDGSVNSK